MYSGKKLDKRKISNVLTLILSLSMIISSVFSVNVLVADDEAPVVETETVLVCGQEEHQHDATCFDEQGNFICELEEHTHDESCFKQDENQVDEVVVTEENNEDVVDETTTEENTSEEVVEENNTPEEVVVEDEDVEEITNDLDEIYSSISFEEASRYEAKYPFDVEQAIKDGETSFGYSRQSPYDKKEEDALKVNFGDLLTNILFNKVYAADPKEYGIPSQNDSKTITYVNLIDDSVYGKNSMYATRLIIGGQILYLDCPNRNSLATAEGCTFKTSSGDDISTIEVYDKSSVKFYLGFEVHHPGVNGGDTLVYELPKGIVWDDQPKKAIMNEDDEENPIAGGFFVMTVNGQSYLLVTYEDKFVNKNSLIDTAIYLSGQVDKSQGDDDGKGTYEFFDEVKVGTNIKDVSKYVTIKKTRSTVQKDTYTTEEPVLDPITGDPVIDEETGLPKTETITHETGKIRIWYYLNVTAYGDNTEIDIDDTYVGNDDGLNIKIDPDSFTLGDQPGKEFADDDERGITWQFTQEPTDKNFKVRINKLGKENGEPENVYLMYAVTFDPVEASYKDYEKDTNPTKTFTINNDASVTSKEYDSFDLDSANFTYTYQGINKSASTNSKEPFSATWSILYNNYGTLNGLVDFGTVTIKDTGKDDTDTDQYKNPDKKYYDHDYIDDSLVIYQSYPGSTSTSTSKWSTYSYSRIYWNIGTAAEPNWQWVPYDSLAYEYDSETGQPIFDVEGNKVKTTFGNAYESGYDYYEKTFFAEGFNVPSTSRFRVEYNTKIDEADLADIDTSDPNSVVMINNTGVYTDGKAEDKDYEEIGVGPVRPDLSKKGNNEENELIAKWTTILNVKDSNVLVKDTYLYDFISIGNTLLTDNDHPLTLTVEGKYYYEATPINNYVTLTSTTITSLILLTEEKTVYVLGEPTGYNAKKYKNIAGEEIWIIEKEDEEGNTQYFEAKDRNDVYSKATVTATPVEPTTPLDNKIYDAEGTAYDAVKDVNDKIYILEGSGEITIPWKKVTDTYTLEECLNDHAACVITEEYIENNWSRGQDGKDHQATLKYDPETGAITTAQPNFIVNIQNIGKDGEDSQGLFASKISNSQDVVRKTTDDGKVCIIYTDGTNPPLAMPQLELEDEEGNKYLIYNSGNVRYAKDGDTYRTYTVDDTTRKITLSTYTSSPSNPSAVSSGEYYNFTEKSDETITLGNKVSPAPTNAVVKKSENSVDKTIAKGLYTFKYDTLLSIDNEEAEEMIRMNNSGNFVYSNKVYIVSASSIVQGSGDVEVNIIDKGYISTVTNDTSSDLNAAEGKVKSENLYTTITGIDVTEYNEMAWWTSGIILSTTEEFVLADTFSQDPTMELVQGSLKVYQGNIKNPAKETWADVKELTNYTLEDNGSEGFNIKFAANTLNAADGSNIIAFYKTVGDYDNNKVYSYTNSVRPIVGGKDIYPTKSATTRRIYRILNKFSETDEGKAIVDYSIKINEERLDIDPSDTLTLYDKMGSFLSYHAGSMKFTKVNEDGTTSEIPTNTEGYTVDASDPQNLVITIPDETSVIITYRCTITVNEIEPTEETANKISMSGYKDFEVESNIQVIVKEREAIASGKQLYIRLFKYDMDETLIPLPGAVFQITAFYVGEVDGKKVLIQLENLDQNPMFETTDENGEIVFIGKYDTVYEIKEIEAPEGYAVSDEVDYFVLPYNYDEEHFTGVFDEYGQEIEPSFYHLLHRVNETRHTIANRKAETTFKLVKVNHNDKPLEGAVFELYNDQDELIKDNLISDENGEILISNLDEGNYYLLEVEAPKGYARQSKKVYFSYDGYNEYTFEEYSFIEYIPTEDQYEHNILKFTNYVPYYPPKTGVE